MINSIIESISIALNAEFGDDYRIYTESVEQGLHEPCFFVFCLNPSSELFLGKRYFRRNNFCIQYFPENADCAKEECSKTAERLYLCLEWLDVCGDITRGTEMKYEISDGVMSFFVNYDMFVYKKEENVPMETISEKIILKE